MDFVQAAPRLGNQYRDDGVLRSHLDHAWPPSLRAAAARDLDALGGLAARAWREARRHPARVPILTRRDAWGARIDRIESTPVWRRGASLAARFGLVARGHEPADGAFARSDQFARVYLHHVASEFHTCALAMSDGAATALAASGNRALIARALPRLLSRDPARLWLAGQWMTETRGGSDIGASETVARRAANGRWRLFGRKWFCSAITCDMALVLARPEGAGGGADALALFFLETRQADGRWNGIRIERLKDKLGTRELPTAEIRLDGALAEPVGELAHGVRQVAPVLNVTRAWNAVCAVATMRRCLALARDYAGRREASGRRLIELPLQRAMLGALQAEFEAAFQLAFFVVELLGRVETGATPETARLLRLLTPIAKLWTARLAVRIASEACEALGGAGYIENTGLPLLLRDAQVYPIWEGTTNVLALDALRVVQADGLEPLRTALRDCTGKAGGDHHGIEAALDRARDWLDAQAGDRERLEAGARGLACTLARATAAALLARHAARAGGHGDPRPRAALHEFARHGLVRLQSPAAPDLDALLGDNGGA
jgi:alkylation response protein AidB-like acyl-CoA dehydrogenase